MAKGYSARGGFSGGGSAMRQQQMQQKLLKMQQDMAAAQEAVENASFTASVGGGVLPATVSGKTELTALTVSARCFWPWKTHLLVVFVIANTFFGVSIASVLFGTFCYRQRTFSARFVMAGTYFRCSLSSSICFSDVVCDFRNIISCAFCRSCGFLALLLSSS